MADRAYLTYGANGVAAAAGPSAATLTTLRCFFLEADGAAIDAYVERVLCGITGGEVTYRAISHHVMVSFGQMTGGRSLRAPFDTMGRLDERQVAFWILVARMRSATDTLVDRYLTFVPYLVVDNPLSLTIGREVNGFAKSWGRIDLDPKHMAATTYGGAFGKDETAGHRPLCTMTMVDDAPPRPGPVFDGIVGMVDWLWPRRRLVPSFGTFDDLKDLLGAGTAWGVFIRQLRAAHDNLLAAYQEVSECQIDISHPEVTLLAHPYDFELAHVDSCPIDVELGLSSQRVPFGIELAADLELMTGETIWSSGASRRRPRRARRPRWR